MPTASSSLRRRAQFTASSNILSPVDEVMEEANISNLFDHYISPCDYRVSNDPLVVAAEEGDVCDATIYGCVRDHKFLLQGNDKVKEIDIRYEYDLYYKLEGEMSNEEDMLEFLEGSMLEHFASILDLKQCPPASYSRNNGSGANRKPSERRLSDAAQKTSSNTASATGSRRLQGFEDEQKNLIIAINSQPTDVKSAEFECLSPPNNGVNCQSMVGYMTIYAEGARLTNETQATIEKAVFAVIEKGMDSNTYAKGAIKGLTFIGHRPIVTTSPPEIQPSPDVPDLTTPGFGFSNDTYSNDTVSNDTVSNDTEIENTVIAVSQGENIESSDNSLGGTQIGIISAASAFIFVAALVGLLLSKRKRKVESLDEDDGALEERSKSFKGSPIRKIVPGIGQQYSLEGCEVPGSLASKDAMALKPQYRRNEDNSNVSDDEIEGSSVNGPVTPPRITNIAADNVVLQQSSSSQEVTFGRSFAAPSVSQSPIRNSRTGLSPSKVSPKRLPASLQAPVRSSSKTYQVEQKRTETSSPTMSILDQLVAEIDAERGTPPRASRPNTIATLQRIANHGSSYTSTFQDNGSGDSRLPDRNINL